MQSIVLMLLHLNINKVYDLVGHPSYNQPLATFISAICIGYNGYVFIFE